MIDIKEEVSKLEKLANDFQDKLNMEKLDELVKECRQAFLEADNIYLRAKRNREKATENYVRALNLRSKFLERSEK